MKVTPNRINELAETIAVALERHFPDTLFIVEPVTTFGLHFQIKALLSEAEMARDPNMVQQVAKGEITRRITLTREELRQDCGALVASRTKDLVSDLLQTILNPL